MYAPIPGSLLAGPARHPLVPGAAGAAPSVTVFSLNLPVGATPLEVAANPADGTVWFTDDHNRTVGSIAADGTIATQATLSGATPRAIAFGSDDGIWVGTQAAQHHLTRVGAGLTSSQALLRDATSVTTGPDGALWLTESGSDTIARVDPVSGSVEEHSVTGAKPDEITAGPDGNLWFLSREQDTIGRITPQWAYTEFDLPSGGLGLTDIVAGPDGNLWFTETSKDTIGRITPHGSVDEFSTSALDGKGPRSIAAGADGNLYFTERSGTAIGQVTPSGTVTQVGGLLTNSSGAGITAGPDGNIWFALHGTGRLGRLTVAPDPGHLRASGVTSAVATLTAPLGTSAQDTTYHVEWGTTTGYGAVTGDVVKPSAAATGPVSVSLSGLAASTEYHARLVATNATGTSTGPDLTFTTTAPGAPSATTGDAGAVDDGAATLNGVVNAQGAATTYQFEWGDDDELRPRRSGGTPTRSPPTRSTTPLSQPLTDLAPNTTYHFRIVATSVHGTTDGADQTFTTDALAPEATTAAATDVTTDAARLRGKVHAHKSPTTYHFEWGTTAAYGNVTDARAVDANGPVAVNEPLGALTPGTTYHARLVATNIGGTSTGDDVTFTTQRVLEPTAVPPFGDPAPAAPAAPETGDAATPDPGRPDDAADRPAVPKLGKAVVADVARGSVRVRTPGGEFVTSTTPRDPDRLDDRHAHGHHHPGQRARPHGPHADGHASGARCFRVAQRANGQRPDSG